MNKRIRKCMYHHYKDTYSQGIQRTNEDIVELASLKTIVTYKLFNYPRPWNTHLWTVKCKTMASHYCHFECRRWARHTAIVCGTALDKGLQLLTLTRLCFAKNRFCCSLTCAHDILRDARDYAHGVKLCN